MIAMTMMTMMMMALLIVNGFKGTASNSMHVPGKKQAYFNFKD